MATKKPVKEPVAAKPKVAKVAKMANPEPMVEQGHTVEQIKVAVSPESHPHLFDDFGNLY